MSTRIAQSTRSLLAILTFLFPPAQITEAEGAPSSLFYSLLSINHSKDTCLKRAHAAVASKAAGSILKCADDLALVNEEYNLAVHCRKTGDKKGFVTIIVVHNASFDKAKCLALNIRRGTETGLFE